MAATVTGVAENNFNQTHMETRDEAVATAPVLTCPLMWQVEIGLQLFICDHPAPEMQSDTA